MFTRSRVAFCLLGGCLAAWTQSPLRMPQPASTVKVNFPADSPVTMVSSDAGETRNEPRGGALLVDVRASLSLRNSSPRRIRGITLLVQSQEVTPGGKVSVTVPSLDVRSGETFPVRVDLRLLRPLLQGGGPLAEITIDGVLFEDLSFYGPDKLSSRRAMTAWELEARRDRRYFKSVLEAKGPEALQQEMLNTMARLADYPQLDVQVVRRGRATAMAARERDLEFAFLRLPDAPLEPVSGMARVAGGEARGARIQVQNRSDKPIRYFEVGWIVRDSSGRQFLAASVPASDPGLKLAPGARSEVLEESALKFSRPNGDPVAIDGMTGFVSQVEFSDGAMWIPSRAALADPKLKMVMAPSPEEQRLADLYRKKGLAALVNELRKF